MSMVVALFQAKNTNTASNQLSSHEHSRMLKAKDLIEEWDKVVYREHASRRSATNTIEAQTKEILKECNPTTYKNDTYKKYDSIFKLVDDDISHIRENRPCHNGSSKLHKLNYGHYVYSEHRQVPCGMNCESASPNEQSFFCLLCVRHNLNFTKVKVLSRWHDLLLPVSVKKREELEWWLKNEAHNMRQVEPAYLDPYGFILLPRINCIIAMVIAYEIRKEKEMKKAIVALLEPKLSKHPNIATTAIEYFEHCLIF
ncbi:hypothetical protein CC86DRAFT_406754 [Ophiobolus disseminans]|uniref:Uncharacterized protein n=1 Tax=Ophiobolus disseminans TaxID=1469910 RepID=A0A6A6ZZQ7_9PLEO|nr:hypothetical protein CC86DRAFT_406754 [Ophiobolus disseminans]